MINRKVRYAKLIEKNPALLDTTFSILEVGSGNFGISELLKRKVATLESEYHGERGEWINPMVSPTLQSQIAEHAFDYVICVDVLGRLNSSERDKAIKELLRISKKKLLLSFPCGEVAMWGDTNYARQLQQLGMTLPAWLQEHIKNGFPALSEVAKIIQQEGYQFELIGNEGMMQHYGGILLDYFYDCANEMLKLHSQKVIHQAPIVESEWDLYYSFLFSIDTSRIGPTESLTSPFNNSPLNNQSDVKLKLYSIFHVPVSMDHFGDLTPLAVGEISPSLEKKLFVTDILENGNQLNNARWSELSGIYKVWKESPSCYVGFCHYRRLFDLRDGEIVNERYARISLEDFPRDATQFNQSFLQLLDQNCIFLPQPELLNQTIFDHYHFTHKINDLCLVHQILQEQFPELSESAAIIFDSRELYANNMFITSWKNFDELCQIWFKVLTIFEGLVESKGQNRYQTRDISFLAERIFSIWVHHKKTQGIKLAHLPFFLLHYPEIDPLEWSPNP